MFPSVTFARLASVVTFLSPANAISYQFDNVGCFSRLNNWQQSSSGQSNTPGTCGSLCQDQNQPLFALSGTSCYCGSEIPPDIVSSNSGQCSSTCDFDPQHSCGGQGAYVVYLIGDKTASTAPASAYGGGATTSSSSSSSTSSTTSTGTTSPTTSSTSSPTTGTTASTSSSTSSSASTSTGSSSESTNTASQTSSTSSSSTTSSSGSSANSDSSSSSPTSTSTSSSASQSSSSAVPTTDPNGLDHHGKDSSDKKSGSSGGAIAGIVVGVVAGVLVIAALVAGLVLWMRRRDKDEYYSPQSSPTQFKNEFPAFHNPYPHNPPRPSMDPRLNPTMLGDPRISIASSADARDYSRQVSTVTNPDEKY